MPSVLSKDIAARILGREWSFGYNCYEVGHTWTPSCTDAALEVSTAAAVRILPLYAMLYLFSQLAVQRAYDGRATWETLKSTGRSTFFIFFHAYNGSIMGCALRRGFGRFYYRVLVCAPALLSSYLSLLIEKPSRRQALAFYLLNMASEILFRMAVTKGYFRPVRHGETLLFAASLGAWYYLLRAHGFGHDPVSAAVKVLIGRDEAKSRARGAGAQLAEPLAPSPSPSLPPPPPSRQALKGDGKRRPAGAAAQATQAARELARLVRQLASRRDQLINELARRHLDGRHATCPHAAQETCLLYVVQPMASRFAIGYVVQSLLKLASRPHQLLLEPRQAALEALLNRQSLNFGLFLLTLVSSGRLASCLLRRYSNSNEPHWHGAAAGFLAGLSMLWAPRSSLSMYIMWKAVEQYYLILASQGRAKHFQATIATIYACSAATILYTFALEPKFVRPSYMKFLDNMSNHRLHQLNRMVLDVFGTGSSVGYEDYFPNLDPKYMSNQFKELVFNWMIQPYE